MKCFNENYCLNIKNSMIQACSLAPMIEEGWWSALENCAIHFPIMGLDFKVSQCGHDLLRLAPREDFATTDPVPIPQTIFCCLCSALFCVNVQPGLVRMWRMTMWRITVMRWTGTCIVSDVSIDRSCSFGLVPWTRRMAQCTNTSNLDYAHHGEKSG